jgi:hypothetical protein
LWVKFFNDLNSSLTEKYDDFLNDQDFINVLTLHKFSFKKQILKDDNIFHLSIPFKQEHLILFLNKFIDFLKLDNFLFINSLNTENIDNKNTTL